ncbi:hypothetical protein IM40_08775 [Candidatus Paracaedimonas acanthamoebae]|nr:hypothetical protein IM40_08775 [Candidatus Paracaedimonas acanthamoebae]
MKNFAQNISFFKTLSVCIILSGFGINVFKCAASALGEEAAEDVNIGGASSSVPMVIPPLNLFESDITSQSPTLRPIPIPSLKELKGQIFWHEFIILDEKSDSRENKRLKAQDAFIAVTDLATMFEEEFEKDKYQTIFSGTNFKQVLSEEKVRMKLILKGQEFEIAGFSDALLGALDQWVTLKECFFSLNKAVTLLRNRIHEDYTKEQEYIARIAFLTKLKKNGKTNVNL